MPDARKLFKLFGWLLVIMTGANIAFWFWILGIANKQVSEQVRTLAMPVSIEGCLPEGETLEWFYFDNAGVAKKEIRKLNLKDVYTKKLKESLKSKGDLASNYITYNDSSIQVVTLTDGVPANSYATAADRGDQLRITVTAKVKLPMMIYPGWTESKLPAIELDVSKNMIVSSGKYKRTK